MMSQDNDKGLRFNQGKPRYDLMEPFAQLQKAQIFTKGAMKYAERNWENGMKWLKCYASASRHAAAWLRGEDRDIDKNCPNCQESIKTGNWSCTDHTGELHSALAAWNWDAITSYYKIFPQGDDRVKKYFNLPKIGLDIDEVIADWVHAWVKRWDIGNVPQSWFFDRQILQRFEEMRESGELDQFYLGLKPLIKPEEIPFEPHCYVTSRPVSVEVTEKWLEMHGFPARPVHTVGLGESKVQKLKEAGVEIFVDDRFDNFVELNKNGIFCYLYDAPHNKRYDVGEMRIKHLSELFKR